MLLNIIDLNDFHPLAVFIIPWKFTWQSFIHIKIRLAIEIRYI